jgi:pyridoxal phosphate enzyme (YggS family)
VASGGLHLDGADRWPALRAADDCDRHRRDRVLCDAPRPADGGVSDGGRDGILTPDSVEERYRRLREAVDEEARDLGRAPEGITLVGVAKKQPSAAIAGAIGAGLADVAENYLQEASAKFAALPPVRKHFIGHVQTNKAKAIAGLFDVVQSVDRPEAAAALGKAAASLGKTLPVLLQLNISPTQRYGCPPDGADALAEFIRAEPGLRLEGVMAIAPLLPGPGDILRAFELAAKTLSRIGGTTLSIGMSGDWREALRAGSTMLRIGEALFGERIQ